MCSGAIIVFVFTEGGSLERPRKQGVKQVPAKKNISNNQAPSHGTGDKLALLILMS